MPHTEAVIIKSEPPDPDSTCSDSNIPSNTQAMVHSMLEIVRKAVTNAERPFKDSPGYGNYEFDKTFGENAVTDTGFQYISNTGYENPAIENMTVKIEPLSYDSDEEQALDLSKPPDYEGNFNGETVGRFAEYNIKMEVKYSDEDDSEDEIQLSKLKEISKTLRKRPKESSDDEYRPLKKKKKKQKTLKQYQGPVKKSYSRKTNKSPDALYPSSVLDDIEIVTISEEQRQVERRELWHSRQHMQYTCEPCAAGYVVEDAYRLHMKIHDPESGDFECELCHTRLRTKDILYRHRLRHYRRYRCRVCHGLFKDKDTAACHVTIDHARLAFVCTYCNKKFKRPQYLKKHIAQMHTKEKRFECPICQVVVYEKGRYRSHVRTHSEEVRNKTSRPTLICDYCARTFTSKTNLKRHLRTHMDTRETVTCSMCVYTCKNKDILRVHFRRTHRARYIEEDDRRCAECLRVFASPALVRHHARRMHSDRIKRYQCDYCKRLYLTKGEVRSHIAWSHMRTSRSAHACHCGRVFRTPARLRLHEQRDHHNVPRARVHRCGHCGKSFAEKQVLNRHIKGHSNETYPCSECGLAFKTQSYVNIHYKLKHLNMTREQIRAERKPRLLNMVDGMKIKKHKNIKPKIPVEGLFENVTIKIEPGDEDPLQVPLFETFADVQNFTET